MRSSIFGCQLAIFIDVWRKCLVFTSFSRLCTAVCLGRYDAGLSQTG